MKNESKIFSKNIFTALKKSFIKILPSLIVCLSLAYLSIKMQTESFTPGGNSVYHYLITQPWVYLRYFIAFFLPLNLSADTDWQVFTNFFDERAIIGYVFIVFLIICIFKTFRNKQTRAISFGLSWFLLSLLPTSSIIPLSEVTNDHRMFFPFVGLCLAVISAIRYVFMKYEAKIFNSLFLKMFILVFTVSVFSANAYGVRQRNKVWSSDESLWYDVTIKSPKNGRGLMNYGLTQMRKANYETALDYFNRALIYTPYYSYLHTNLGVLHNAMGNKQIAEEYFVNGINYGEDIYVSHYYYSKFLFENNRFQEALLEAEKTRKLSPYYLQNNHLLYDIYFELNKIDELLILVNKTLDIYPGDEYSLVYKNFDYSQSLTKLQLAEQTANLEPSAEKYLNLSLEYYNLGEFYKCIEACYKSLELKPDYALAYNNICSAYNALGEWDKAIEACEKALQIDANFTLANNNLKLAFENKK